jgi:putative flippase GtrA
MTSKHKRVLKVGASGVIAALVDLVVLLVLVELLAVPVVTAVFLGASSGAVASFLVNKYWAFGDKAPISILQLLSFAGVALGSAFGVAAVVQLLSVQWGLPYLLAKGVGALLVFAFWSYPVQSRFVFPGQPSAHITSNKGSHHGYQCHHSRI